MWICFVVFELWHFKVLVVKIIIKLVRYPFWIWTNQKHEKYLSEGRNPFACSPPCLLSNEKFSNVYWKVFCCFWPIKLFNQSSWFISRGIGRSYFFGNFLLSFLLWNDFKILVKSRGGGTFLSLALSVNIWQR